MRKSATGDQRPVARDGARNFIVDVVKVYGVPFICLRCGSMELLVDGQEKHIAGNCPNPDCQADFVERAGPRQKFAVGINEEARRIRMEKKR